MERKYDVNNPDISETGTTYSSSMTAALVASRLRRERRAKEKVKPRSRYQVRQLKSRGALQVLLWNLLVFSHQSTVYNNLLGFFGLNQPWKNALAAIFLQQVLPNLLYPVAGWIADAKVGRYKVIRFSLFLMWLGSVFLLLIAILKYSVVYSPDEPLSVNDRYNKAKIWALILAILTYILNSVGIAGFHANIIPFGLDQMEDGSTEQHSAFIHWYYWTRKLSFGVLIWLAVHSSKGYCEQEFSFGPNSSKPDFHNGEFFFRLGFIPLVFDCVFLTAALCIDFIFSPRYLNKDPKTHYPIRRIWKISKFIRENNQLVGRRKAITFTYDAPPTRWDFAKRLYGGPFDEDDVEDVHTFWRILGFIFSVGLCGVFIIHQGYNLYGPFIKHMKLPTIFSKCISEFAISHLTPNATIILVIPIYEFIVYPLFRRYILRILRRIGLGMILALIGTIGILLIDSFGHRASMNIVNGTDISIVNGSEHCMLFNVNFSAPSPIKYEAITIMPIIFVISLGEFLIFIPTFEFICAQSPFSMRGMLIGLFYASQAIFVSLAGLLIGIIVAVVKIKDARDMLLSNLSCGSWYLSFSIGIGIIGFILYIIAARRYSKRERGGHMVNEQTILEEYYEPKDNKITKKIKLCCC